MCRLSLYSPFADSSYSLTRSPITVTNKPRHISLHPPLFLILSSSLSILILCIPQSGGSSSSRSAAQQSSILSIIASLAIFFASLSYLHDRSISRWFWYTQHQKKKKRNKKLLDFFFFTFPLRVDKFLLHRIIIHSVSIVQMSDDNFSRDTLEISRKRTNQQRLLSLL